MQLPELVAKSRVKLATRVRTVLLGKVSGPVPKTSVRSIIERLDEEEIARHVVDWQEIAGATVQHYPFPSSYLPQFRRTKAFDERLLYRLTDVLVDPGTGLVWTPQGRILEESVGSLRRLLSWGNALHAPLAGVRSRSTDGPFVACPTIGYFHFITEVLPGLLHTFQRYPDIRVALGSTPAPYVISTLQALLSPTAYRRRVVQFDRPVLAEEYIMPAVTPYAGFVHDADLSALRQFQDRLSVDGESPLNLYVSRRATKNRTMSREAELEQALKARGFTVLFTESLPFLHQVRLFSRAQLVVGPHGAGLTNLLWSSAPKGLLEIFPHDKFNDCFARLAVTLGSRYDHIRADHDPTTAGTLPVERVLDWLASTSYEF